MNTDVIYERMKHQRKNGTSLNRYGCVDKDGVILAETNYVCYASLKSAPYTKAHMIWTCWNGEAPGNRKPEDGFGDRDNPMVRRSEYLPGPLSDRWLAFMLDPVISPWRAILGHLITTDPVIIRKSGLIFKDLDNLDFGLLFNFLIATRYCYEFSHKVEFWQELVDEHGVDPRAAYLICCGYKKSDNTQKKPPLRKELVRPAGYRKNAGGFRYIRDEFGDKKWFEAEYKEVDDFPDWKKGKWDLSLTQISGDGHSPLPTCFGFERAILNGTWTPMGKTIRRPPAWQENSWDIFRTEDDNLKKRPTTLPEVLDYFKTLIKE